MYEVRKNIEISKEAFVEFIQKQDPNCNIDFSQKFAMVHLKNSLVFEWREPYVAETPKPASKKNSSKKTSKQDKKFEPSALKIG